MASLYEGPVQRLIDELGRLPGVGMRLDGERLVQGEDQRQEGRRQAPVPGRRQPALPVAGVGGHVAAQRLRGYVAVMLIHHAG